MGTPLPGTATAGAYVDLLNRTQPDGPYWPTADSLLTDIHEALAPELVRFHGRVIDYLEEANPGTADQMLEGWEEVLGLTPATTATDDERRAACATAYIATGGNSAAYFEQLAASMGLAGTFVLDQTAGSWMWGPHSPPCMPLYSAYHAFVWEVHSLVAATAAQRTTLETLFERIKPAHTQVEFFYDVV